MFSGGHFGEFAFSEHTFTPVDTTAFTAFLAEIAAERCWLLEVDALSLADVPAGSAAFSDAAFGERSFSGADALTVGGVQTLRFSTHGYASRAADTPASTWYDNRLEGGVRAGRSITGRDGLGGVSRVTGEATLVNADGALDTLTLNYALDGRRARLLIGRPTDALADYGLVFSGVVEAVSTSLDVVRLRLSDGTAKLERVVNETVYAGTGGNEGGDDLKGKAKPCCYGTVENIAPPLVDSAALVYQVHYRVIQDVPAVYDRGVSLTKVAGAPAAGEYQVTASAGTFKLGATPAGTVTCDVEGDASGAGYINGTADIVRRLLVDHAGLASSEIEPASFGTLSTAPVGVWLDTERRSVGDVVDELLAGIGAFGGFARQGGFTVAHIYAPGGTPVLWLEQADIIELSREPLPSLVEPAVWRASVGWQKNYTVQDDLAASVSAARRTFCAEPMRYAQSENSAIQTRHPLAVEFGPVEALYAAEADAEAEALRLFDLWSSTQRALYVVKTRPKALQIDLGDVVQVTHPRFGLALGRAMLVLGHSLEGSAVTLALLA